MRRGGRNPAAPRGPPTFPLLPAATDASGATKMERHPIKRRTRMPHSRDGANEPISREHVAHLASLARIDLDPEELDTLGHQLRVIVDHVRTVQAAAGPDLQPMSHPIPEIGRASCRESVTDCGVVRESR